MDTTDQLEAAPRPDRYTARSAPAARPTEPDWHHPAAIVCQITSEMIGDARAQSTGTGVRYSERHNRRCR